MKKNKMDEKMTSQVKSIYRDDGDTMLASVKHIRSTVYDNDEYQDTDEVEYKAVIPKIKEKTKVENKVEEKRVPAWNYATAVDEVEENAVEGVNDEESMHITCMPTENLMCSKVCSYVHYLRTTCIYVYSLHFEFFPRIFSVSVSLSFLSLTLLLTLCLSLALTHSHYQSPSLSLTHTYLSSSHSHDQSWGSPKALLQISNLSSEWSVGVYWVDEDSVLIFRKMLHTYVLDFIWLSHYR